MVRLEHWGSEGGRAKVLEETGTAPPVAPRTGSLNTSVCVVQCDSDPLLRS